MIRALTRTCGESPTRREVDVRLRQTRQEESAAVRSKPLTRAIDLENQLCDTSRCHSANGTTLMYRDTDHLSVDGALTLTGAFYRAIASQQRRTSNQGTSRYSK